MGALELANQNKIKIESCFWDPHFSTDSFIQLALFLVILTCGHSAAGIREYRIQVLSRRDEKKKKTVFSESWLAEETK